jgi:ankyrin repeat protein
MFASRQGGIDAARALVEAGADLNAAALPQTDVPLKPEDLKANEQGWHHPLVFAIINSHFDLAAMLEKGADPNRADIAGMPRSMPRWT